jgi:hypothetical protein
LQHINTVIITHEESISSSYTKLWMKFVHDASETVLATVGGSESIVIEGTSSANAKHTTKI